ncbi:MAG: hypothetical protein AB9873_07480 [Syntrophobacteraceae bacterium]
MRSHMSQAIFHLKASVPATSLYLLICSMLDEGRAPTLDRARGQWTGTEESFNGAVDELTRRGVLQPPRPLENGKPVGLYLSSHWRRIV